MPSLAAASQLRREVKQLVDEWLPSLEINSAQTDAEVLEILLRQLGYPANPAEEVQAAWLSAVRIWRAKKAQDERYLAGLRLFLETGSMANVLDDLPPSLHESSALINATLTQFEVPADMPLATVTTELLQELDMDSEDVAEGAQPALVTGLTSHMEWRRAASESKLRVTLADLRELIQPSGGAATSPHPLPRSSALTAERLVAKALTQMPGKLTSNMQAFADLLGALNLTSDNLASANEAAEPALAAGVVLRPGVFRLLRDATVTHCEALRRQARREVSIKRLQKLLISEVGSDDPLASGEAGGEGDEGEEGPKGTDDPEADADEEADTEKGSVDTFPPASTASLPPTSWEEHGAALVADVYGGYEEQAREMKPLELLLDILRMAQLQEDEVRKAERAALEAAIAGFHRDIAAAAEQSLPPEPSSPEGTSGTTAAAEERLAAAGWRLGGLGSISLAKVSSILQRGGGDGSDFALVLAALLHSLGVKVRLSVICVPPNRATAAIAAPTASATRVISYSQRRCRLLAEARVGLHPSRAAAWVAARHASGAGAASAPSPHVHFRRESDGATWLSLSWRPGDVLPGRPYLEPIDALDEAEWTTFYPFDEHGCKWHSRGAEADSSGRLHGSPPIRSMIAEEWGVS